jgi:hypothetical protein
MDTNWTDRLGFCGTARPELPSASPFGSFLEADGQCFIQWNFLLLVVSNHILLRLTTTPPLLKK